MVNLHEEGKKLSVKLIQEQDWTVMETVAVLEIAKNMVLYADTATHFEKIFVTKED